MRHSKFALLLITTLLMALSCAESAYANKAAVTIEAPESAANGDEITIKVKVIHSADNIFHHVDWAYIMVNGREVERWEYSWHTLPPDATFTKEIKYKVQGPIEIKAEAHCNIHGSKGPAFKTISIK
jgi:desulfoferrodoxin (superoxide reductase-like protein)